MFGILDKIHMGIVAPPNRQTERNTNKQTYIQTRSTQYLAPIVANFNQSNGNKQSEFV